MAQRILDWTAVKTADRKEAPARCLAAARALEPALGAFAAFAEELPAAADGPLRHLPYAAKDLFALPGRAPSCGLSAGVKGMVTGRPRLVELLEEAGAVRVGLARMTALAYEPSGCNEMQGTPRNPWNVEFAPGGSSSGSGVAAAAGAAFVTIGSDTGGSVRLPAHCCGVTGWKSTWGLVPVDGAMPLAPSLDTLGLLARSARDIEAVRAGLAIGQDEDRLPARSGRALLLSDALERTEPAPARVCREGLDALELAGLRLDKRAAFDRLEKRLDGPVLKVMQAEAARAHRRHLDDPALAGTLRKRLAKGLETSDAELADLVARRQGLAREAQSELLAGFDCLVLPVMPIRTPPVAECDPTSPQFRPRTLYEMSALTRWVNYLGFPAVALPVGFDDRGMPVAIQLVGAPGSDARLLALAAAVQQATDWHGRLPAALAPGIAGLEGLLG